MAIDTRPLKKSGDGYTIRKTPEPVAQDLQLGICFVPRVKTSAASWLIDRAQLIVRPSFTVRLRARGIFSSAVRALVECVMIAPQPLNQWFEFFHSMTHLQSVCWRRASRFKKKEAEGKIRWSRSRKKQTRQRQKPKSEDPNRKRSEKTKSEERDHRISRAHDMFSINLHW